MDYSDYIRNFSEEFVTFAEDRDLFEDSGDGPEDILPEGSIADRRFDRIMRRKCGLSDQQFENLFTYDNGTTRKEFEQNTNI